MAELLFEAGQTTGATRLGPSTSKVSSFKAVKALNRDSTTDADDDVDEGHGLIVWKTGGVCRGAFSMTDKLIYVRVSVTL